MCGSTRLNGFDLLWLQSRSERTIGTNRTVKKVHRMGRKAEKRDAGAKGRCTADEDEFSEMTKTAKRVDCFSAHGSRSEKKCDTWAKAR